jgi:hypothetical protein
MTALKFVSAGALLLATSSLFACSPAASDKCPTFNVGAEVGKDGAGTATFTLTPTRDNLTYTWTTSSGAITSGEGSPKVVITDQTPGASVTATVEIGGLDASCTTKTASATATMP